MKTAPVRAARIDLDPAGPPRSLDFDDVYHSRAGALGQARHVFLGGNRLPARWQGRARFTVLETGFGLGHNFLATWQAWRDDPQACERLHYVGIELHPPSRSDLAQVLRAGGALPALAAELVAAWPPLTANWHALHFEGGRVQLLLGFFDLRGVLPELVATVDAFYLDGFAPPKNPAMWERRVLKALGRMAAPGATAGTWSVARELRDGLAEAGFEVERAAGFEGKREMTVARFAPRFAPAPAPARHAAAPSREPVLVVGGGLAGCATAWALAEQGVPSRVLDAGAAPARGTSGNPAGMFHGTVGADDGPHVRFNRSAALVVARVARAAITSHGLRGEVGGLLRVDAAGLATMQALVERHGLPPDYAQALGAAEAARRAGLALREPAWFFPEGGWLEPPGLARSYLALAAGHAQWRGGLRIAALRAGGAGWELLDDGGHVVDSAATVVLACAADALRLAAAPPWPLQAWRGQLTGIAADTPGLPAPSLPVAGAGYVLPPLDGRVWCGATRQAGDDDPAVRAGDHAANLAQLARWLPQPLQLDAMELQGRTGWRLAAADRLPLVGAMPLTPPPAAARLEQARFVPRRAGLYLHTALGSRGIAASALGGRVLAALISGAPCPLEASLLDAIDPARFVSRQQRRAAAGPFVSGNIGPDAD